jgi:hypothetical protein
LNIPAISLSFAAVRKISAEEQSGKLTHTMEMRTKLRCVTEFLNAAKITPVEIQRRLLNVYGDQTVDVSTVRRWMMRFSNGVSDVATFQ